MKKVSRAIPDIPDLEESQCVEGKCTYLVIGIKCTDMCSYKTCDNQPLQGVVDEEDDQDEDEIDLDENEDDENFVIDFD